MDELLHSVQAYEKMLNKSYDIVLGKKGTTENIHIEFREDGFHHLTGLQYLQQNMPELRKNKRDIFYRILKEEKFREKIENAPEYNEILGRVISVSILEQLLDSPGTEVYKCNKGRGSSIEADYMFKGKAGSDNVYFFIRENKNEKGLYNGCSIFPEEKQKSGHSYAKVLHKVKHDSFGTHELYISPNYKPQSANNIMQTKFDNPLSDMQFDGTLAVSASDIFRNALRSLIERLETFIQNIATKIQETLTIAISKPQNADTTLSADTTPSETAEQKSEPVQQETELAPEDDDGFIIKDIYSLFVSGTGVQGYENYFMFVPESELDFHVPITYKTEQIQEKQDMEQEVSEEKAIPLEFRKRQAEYDDL